MKKFMPVVLSSALVLPFAGVAQADGPIDGTVYGKIYMNALKSETKGVSDTSMNAENSRLGFKGKTKLENGMAVIYQLEYGVEPTEAAASTSSKSTGATLTDGADAGTDVDTFKDGKYTDTTIFSQRNAFAGLATNYGTILGGTHDTPVKLAQGSIDQFNDLPVGDIKSLVRGEVRANDVIAYISPAFKNITVMAVSTQDEGSGDNASSFSVKYDANGIYLAAAKDNKVGSYDTTRLVAEYKAANFTVGAMHNGSKPSAGGDSASSNLISGSYKLDNLKFRAQYGTGDEQGEGGKLTGLGMDYILSKQSRVYIYNAKYSNDDAAKTLKATAIGLEHNF